MKNYLAGFILIFVLFTQVSAEIFIPSYLEAEILLLDSDLNMAQLSQDLNILRPDLKGAQIRYPGELMRDTLVAEYVQWYQANYHPATPTKLLESRVDHVNQVLTELWGAYLLIPHKKDGETYLSLFIKGDRYPQFTRVKPDSKPLSTWISENLFDEKAVRRLSHEERAQELALPAAEYYEEVKLDRFIAIGLGQHKSVSRSNPPPFKSFYQPSTKDTSDILTWSQISSPLYQVSLGWNVAELFGGGFMAKYSSLAMNYESKTNPGVQIWHYDRYEFGIFGTIGKTYYLSPNWSVYPHGYLSFQYIIFDEEFKILEDTPASLLRVKLHTINGASGALGFKTLYKRQFGVDIQWGLNHASGKSPDDFEKAESGVSVNGRDKATIYNEQYVMIQLVYNTPSSF